MSSAINVIVLRRISHNLHLYHRHRLAISCRWVFVVEPIKAVLAKIDNHRFALCILSESVETIFATHATQFHTAPRRRWVIATESSGAGGDGDGDRNGDGDGDGDGNRDGDEDGDGDGDGDRWGMGRTDGH